MLDGGGSTEMVCSSENTYKVVNRPSDGSERAVINMLAVVYSSTKRAEQGSLDYIYDISDLDYTNIVFNNPGSLLPLQNPNVTEYSINDGALRMTTTDSTNDPHITMSYHSASEPVSADRYKYLLLRLRTDNGAARHFKIYFQTSVSGISEENSVSVKMTTDGQWHTYLIDLSAKSGWKGNIESLRFDYLDQAIMSRGEYVDLKSVRLYTTYDEADAAMSSDSEMPYKLVPVNFPERVLRGSPLQDISLVRAFYTSKDSELISAPDFSVNLTEYDMYSIGRQTIKILYKGTEYPFELTVYADPSLYTDVSESKWYKNDVYYSTEHGLFEGINQTEFKPDIQMTRAMFVTVLARMNGVDLNEYSFSTSPFDDVGMKNWFFKAIMWASENSITNGTSGNTFSPNDCITREQMCLFITRYADYMGYSLRSDSNTPQFSDYSSISEYARSAVDTCRLAGLVGCTMFYIKV